HLSAAPPLDVALHVPGAADQALGGIGGGERPLQSLRQPETDDGERFVQPFAHALGSTGILVLQASREIAATGWRSSRQRPDTLAAGSLAPTADRDRSGTQGRCG